jgi:tRNA A58 N-methylase Trm61
MIDVGGCSHFVVLDVLKPGELVENVDAQLADEGIIVFVLERSRRITGYSIVGGIFVVL